mgnify:CR=1 FL=1
MLLLIFNLKYIDWIMETKPENGSLSGNLYYYYFEFWEDVQQENFY